MAILDLSAEDMAKLMAGFKALQYGAWRSRHGPKPEPKSYVSRAEIIEHELIQAQARGDNKQDIENQLIEDAVRKSASKTLIQKLHLSLAATVTVTVETSQHTDDRTRSLCLEARATVHEADQQDTLLA
jgi:hypothetical protein